MIQVCYLSGKGRVGRENGNWCIGGITVQKSRSQLHTISQGRARTDGGRARANAGTNTSGSANGNGGNDNRSDAACRAIGLRVVITSHKCVEHQWR